MSFLTELLSIKGLLGKVARFLTFIGVLTGFIFYLNNFWAIEDVALFVKYHGGGVIFYNFVGVIISGLGLFLVAKPNEPIPWNWVSLFILGGLMVFFLYVPGAILIFFAAFLEFGDTCILENLDEEQPTN